MAAISSISVTLDMSKAIDEATKQLLRREVVVGIPASGADRQPGLGEKNPPNNAVIGYIQELGDDEKHIPARPFLVPGVESARDDIVKQLKAAGQGAMSGDKGAVNKGLTAVGEDAVEAVRNQIMNGSFAPLSVRTIEARAKRKIGGTNKLSNAASAKNARAYLKLQGQGVPDYILNDPGVGLATPLLDTRQMFGAVKFVVRDKGST